MAEVLNGQPRDFQSDLFSVGILAYVLLTGQHPFLHNSGLLPIAESITSETNTLVRPSELKKDIPEKYERIVMRLLERDRSKRYQEARQVLDEWQEKSETVQCSECNNENPGMNKFCGQCGHDLRTIQEVETEPEKDLGISFSLFNAGRTREAISYIQQSLRKNKRFANGWSHLGFMLNFERRYEEAEDACTKSIGIDRESSRAYQTRGFARSNLGKFDAAIEDFTMALDKETDDRRRSRILYHRAYSKRLSGRFEEAFEDANESVKLDGTNTKAQKLKDELLTLLEGRD